MPTLTKSERSQLARKTVIRDIPAVLQASARARAGVRASTLLREPPPVAPPTSPQSTPAAPPTIRVVAADTLDAAFPLATDGRGRVALLSMASELRPGGGFLGGASAQEESLCLRSTLHAGLRDEFYRLPERGCVYTPDVCVFRGVYGDAPKNQTKAPTGTEVNPAASWWFADVVSCAAVRAPDVVSAASGAEAYADAAQRDLMREKIKVVLRAAAAHGCRRLVLGAFGCGAFGNPPAEVAQLFRRVLLGRDGTGVGRGGGEFAGCFDEVLFAIKGGRKETFAAFEEVFPPDAPDARDAG
ncbi:hypothetical protein FB451DRAFT_1350675 [Mycena latifolia]|nr:hypothetical protein FB451DRAFT_1350675 [Mycena latifolia]